MFAVKIYSVPADIEGTIKKWIELGIDTIMTGRDCLYDAMFLQKIHEAGMKLSVVEPVFLAPSGIEAAQFIPYEPSILEDGREAVDDWVRFVCPTDEKYLEYVYQRINKDTELGADILTFDFARFFLFWEMVLPETQPSALKQSCYCTRCRKASSSYPSVNEWRKDVVTRAVRNCAAAAKSVKPAVKTGVHIVPWKTDMFPSDSGDDTSGALEAVLGQDLRALSESVDFLAPMTYHHMIHQSTDYIGEVIENHRGVIKDAVPIVPSVQVKELYRKDVLPRCEFKEALKTALKHSTGGVSFYQWSDIEESPESFRIIKEELEKYGK